MTINYLPLLVVLAGVGLVGCSPVPSTSAETSIAPTSVATVEIASTPGSARRAVGRDPLGDLVDADGKAVVGPTSLDVTRLEADAIGSDLRLQLTVVTAPPPNLPSGTDVVSYVFGLDTGGDATPDYLISFENREDGSWVPSLQDQRRGHRFEGSEFPGSIVFQERVVLVQLALSAVGAPASLKICALTQSAVRGDGQVNAEDNVPDGDCRLGAPMLTLE